MCPAGSECVTQPCTECTPCEAGYYKDAAGSAHCSPCRAGTYNQAPGAASINECLLCPSGAHTDQHGSTSVDQCKCNEQSYVRVNANGALSCEACPVGARCPDLSCALHHSIVNLTCPGSSDPIVGTWKLDSADGKYKIKACPAGYKFTTEECIQCSVCLTAGDWCSRADYILNSNSTDSACQVCPEGAECNGALLRTKKNLQGATWVIEGDRYFLKSCPTGHRLVNNLGYESQKCEPCGASEYILKSDDPSFQCLPCPARSEPAPSKLVSPSSPWPFLGTQHCHLPHHSNTRAHDPVVPSAPTEGRPSKLRWCAPPYRSKASRPASSRTVPM